MQTPITQLLLHFDASPQAVQRLEAACRIAKQHGSALTALYAATPHYVELPFAPEIGPGIVAVQRQADQRQLSKARAAFDQSQSSPQGSAGVRAAWAEIHDDPILSTFVQQALFADLLVMGQHDPSDAQMALLPSDFVQSVVMMSGKPALVLPYIGAPKVFGDTALIAWKPTREAARAVAAALPMLQSARAVHVVSWGEEESSVSGDRLDLTAYLKLRGIQPTWHKQGPAPKDLGEMLLSFAFDIQADLLVMGCYGHSRAREWVLGGVTRTLLGAMTLPVLMAH
jgi:nucleotide-binding universal stress UspA family protein